MNIINNTLPNHLIFENILPKLPVKSLLRYKLVSKLWNSTISSPEFVKSHLQFSSLSPNFILLLAGNDGESENEFYLLNPDNNKNHRLRHFHELEVEDGSNNPVQFFYIVGSCNGIVGLHSRQRSGEAYFISNPATRRHRKIKIPKGVEDGSRSGCVFYHESSTDDYKLLGAFPSGKYVQFHVYSLNSGNWTKISKLNKRVKSIDLEYVALIHDTIYIDVGMLTWKLGNPIVGFDLVTEQFKELHWMNWLNRYTSVRLLELRGCLSLICSTVDFAEGDVWMLKDSNDMNSWEKLFSVNHTDVLYCGIFDTGKCLLQTEGKLRVFDPARETPQMSQEGIAFNNGDIVVQSIGYVESLVRLSRAKDK